MKNEIARIHFLSSDRSPGSSTNRAGNTFRIMNNASYTFKFMSPLIHRSLLHSDVMFLFFISIISYARERCEVCMDGNGDGGRNHLV